jgi:chromosomal replication initiation ATPase DnaA
MRAPDEIMRMLAFARGIKVEKLRAKARDTRTSHARQELMWLLDDATEMNHTDIAAFLRRDRSTVIFGIRKISAQIAARPGYALDLRGIVAPVLNRPRTVVASGVIACSGCASCIGGAPEEERRAA